MKDSLEIFIQKQRHGLDAHSPAPGVWNRIEAALERTTGADSMEKYVISNRIFLDTALPPETVWARLEHQLASNRRADALEYFIGQNRENFDEIIPDSRIWPELSAKLPKDKPRFDLFATGWQRNLIRAAAVFVLLVTGLGAGIWYAHSSNTPEMTMAQVSPEYAELERHYEQMIGQKRGKLVSLQGSQPAAVEQDLKQLDNGMQDLRKELALTPPANRPQVVRAMIGNYKAQTLILERVLGRLESAELATK